MGEQVAAPFLKKSFYSFCGNQAGVAIRKWKMYLENCTQIVFLKRKATSDFYDKKELRLNQFSQ